MMGALEAGYGLYFLTAHARADSSVTDSSSQKRDCGQFRDALLASEAGRLQSCFAIDAMIPVGSDMISDCASFHAQARAVFGTSRDLASCTCTCEFTPTHIEAYEPSQSYWLQSSSNT